LATSENDIILDSFAGSGTTAHAVLELNKEDGGNRKFILVEQEDYSNTITAERVRRVIKKMSAPLIETDSDDSIDSTKKTSPNHNNQDNQQKSTVQTFTYFELGAAIEMEAILTQNALPSYLEFARYLFYIATGEQFNEKIMNMETGFIGESKNYEVYLFYQPDIEWLKANALTLDQCRSFPKFKGKQRLVFAPCKYVDDDTCLEYRIDFCQLPYEIYRMQK
jgi:adenine-specific DNA-methyltransferase